MCCWLCAYLGPRAGEGPLGFLLVNKQGSSPCRGLSLDTTSSHARLLAVVAWPGPCAYRPRGQTDNTRVSDHVPASPFPPLDTARCCAAGCQVTKPGDLHFNRKLIRRLRCNIFSSPLMCGLEHRPLSFSSCTSKRLNARQPSTAGRRRWMQIKRWERGGDQRPRDLGYP